MSNPERDASPLCVVEEPETGCDRGRRGNPGGAITCLGRPLAPARDRPRGDRHGGWWVASNPKVREVVIATNPNGKARQTPYTSRGRPRRGGPRDSHCLGFRGGNRVADEVTIAFAGNTEGSCRSISYGFQYQAVASTPTATAMITDK